MVTPWRRLGVYLDLVYVFPGTIGVGTALGYLADRWLGTSPYGTMLGFLLGLAGAFWYLFRMLGVFGHGGRPGGDDDRP